MYRNIITNLICFLEDNPSLSPEPRYIDQLKKDENSFKTIDFYAPDAAKQIQNQLQNMENFQTKLENMLNYAEDNDYPETTQSRLEAILRSLNTKYQKLQRIQELIPQGMLDVKRAIIIALSQAISTSEPQNQEITASLVELKTFMSELNKEYTQIIKDGGTLQSFIAAINTLYKEKLPTFSLYILNVSALLQDESHLTHYGVLIKTCLLNALNTIPNNPHTFTSKLGNQACQDLEKQNKRFFYVPSRDDNYHFDFDPEADLAGTGGNCYGESMMFMHGLEAGTFKFMCPEPGIINYQLDQTRHSRFEKSILGDAQTDVSATSRHKYLQWDDVQQVFLNNPNFQSGDICGLILSMNEYTKSKRSFTCSHIAVVAKMDTNKSPYKYLVYEKSFGAIGIEDEADLEHILKDIILPLYKGMGYSKIKLTKYTEATENTYALMRSIQPINNSKNLQSSIANDFTLFGTQKKPIEDKVQEKKNLGY